MVDAISGLSIVNTIAEATRTLYQVAKGLKDLEVRQQLDNVLEKLGELRQRASELEDENRNLRDRLRFKSDEYEFRNPFWFHKTKPEEPLCPKCFAKGTAAPMAASYDNSLGVWRKCLVCDATVEVIRKSGQTAHRRLPYSRR